MMLLTFPKKSQAFVLGVSWSFYMTYSSFNNYTRLFEQALLSCCWMNFRVIFTRCNVCCHLLAFSFPLSPLPKIYRLVLFLFAILISVFIFLIFFLIFLFIFNLVFQFHFGIYYLFRFSPYCFDFSFFFLILLWSFCLFSI